MIQIKPFKRKILSTFEPLMERLSINYYHPEFNPAIADDCTLKVVIGTDGLSLCVKNNSGSTLVLKSWMFDTAHHEQSIRRILNSNDLAAYPYGKTLVSHFTQHQTLAPRRMYDMGQPASYLETIAEQVPPQIFTQEIQELDSFLIWAPAQTVTDICQYFYPAADQTCQSSPLLLRAREMASGDAVRIFAHLRSSHIQIMAFERSNLLFFNTFKYEKPADVLYFTLLVYDQLNIKPTQSGLMISGELLEESEIYRQFQRFIREIRFMPSPILPGVPQHILPHIYLDQTIS